MRFQVDLRALHRFGACYAQAHHKLFRTCKHLAVCEHIALTRERIHLQRHEFCRAYFIGVCVPAENRRRAEAMRQMRNQLPRRVRAALRCRERQFTFVDDARRLPSKTKLCTAVSGNIPPGKINAVTCASPQCGSSLLKQLSASVSFETRHSSVGFPPPSSAPFTHHLSTCPSNTFSK